MKIWRRKLSWVKLLRFPFAMDRICLVWVRKKMFISGTPSSVRDILIQRHASSIVW